MTQHYVVTGTSRGIGLELTRALLAEGHSVSAIARNPEKSAGLSELKKQYVDRLRTFTADVTRDDDVKRVAQELTESGAIDVLINCAGTFLDYHDDFLSIDFKKILQSLETNTLGPMRVTRALLPLLQKSKRAKVVHITSLMGSIGDNTGGGSYAYRMSKAALNMFMKSFSVDFPSLITLVVHPGWVKTDMGGSQAPVLPRDSARGILNVIQRAEREQSGKFFDFEGDELPW
ncbi:MAG: SDR family oxidoreductase [Oligoflexia bacterium]|nr:SDR family oxidoreductase [Oligoflexia bacterium]